jgi:hypothetical protein
MQNEQEIVALLTEIRDTQQKLLAEYSKAASESLAIQKQAFAIQQQAISQQQSAVLAQGKHLRLYRLVLVVAAPIVAYLLWQLSRLVS